MDQTLVSQSMVENLTRKIHKNDPSPKDSCNSVLNCFQNRFKIKLHSDLKKAFNKLKCNIFKLKLLVKVENIQSNEYDDDGGDGNSIVYDI